MRATIVPLAVLLGFLAVVALEPRALGDEPCPGRPDCNGNNEDDRCDVSCTGGGIFCVGGQPANAACNSGWFPSCGTSGDCNENTVPDECDIAGSTSEDCNANQIPDECEACINEDWEWNSPCVGGLACLDHAEQQDFFGVLLACWCEGDWAVAASWHYLGNDCGPNCPADSDWPGGVSDHALIQASSAVSLCVDGADDGDVCLAPSDCADPGTCEQETELRIEIPTVTILEFVIRTANELSGVDWLKLDLRGNGLGAPEVLETQVLQLDATQGTLTISVSEGGQLKVQSGS